MKILLFDVDQTLVNTGGAGIRALNRAFETLFSVTQAMHGVSSHGKTDRAIVREIFLVRDLQTPRVEDVLEHVLESYLSFLPGEVGSSDNYQVLPGIADLLRELAGHDRAIVGLATGNVERGARIKLERGGLNGFFDFGGFGSDSESRPELVRRAADRGMVRLGRTIDPSDVVVIGDTPLDVDAAHQCGFRSVAVATGRFTKAELLACNPDQVLEDFAAGRDQFLRSTFME